MYVANGTEILHLAEGKIDFNEYRKLWNQDWQNESLNHAR